MHIKINNVDYAAIRDLTFTPQTDIMGNELPINEFSAEIKTDHNISVGKYAYLYGDNGNLWAKYHIVEAQRLSPRTVTVRCQSDILLLERKKLPAKMCNKASAYSIISECFRAFNLPFSISPELTDKTITGYLPEQTVRERLQWVCFVLGGYVKSFFSDRIQILAISDSVKYIQADRTFYRPKLQYKDYVTAVRATAYTYTQGTPSSVDTWVKDGNTYYIQTSQQASLNNANVPAGTPDNIIDLSGITIVNDDNISDVLTRLAAQYFNREELTADILNEGEVKPGEKVAIYDGVSQIISGYVKSAGFKFGKSSKSTITLSQTVSSNAVKLTIIYHYDGEIISRETYTFPANTAYSLQNSYVDKTTQGKRRVYLPLTETTEGTTGTTSSTADVQCEAALEFSENILDIISVDSASQSREVLTIG